MNSRGAILRIDLSVQKVTKGPIPADLCQRLVGGEGINDWLFWEHFLKVSPKIDPLSPDNVLILGAGPLGGTGLGLGTKMRWTFKSPMTGMFGDGASGGLFPANLRWAGYDHVVITGKAERPVYIWIDDEDVQIRDAAHLWGKNTVETERLIREELGDSQIAVARIGQAGENLVSYGSIIVTRARAVGRAGGGCVCGSKNLKAIAVRGTKGITIHDPAGLMETVDDLAKTVMGDTSAGRYKRWGTLPALASFQKMGGVTYRNNQHSVMPEEKFDKISHTWYTSNIAMGALSCSPGCFTACSGWWKIRGDESPAATKLAGMTGRRFELSALTGFGAMCDIPDFAALTLLWEKVNQYGMDVMETGSTCAFLMELWQRGIITRQDTIDLFGEPLCFEWGNYELIEKVIESVALQDGKLGLLLKDGVYKTAQRLEKIKNVPLLKYALYGKGHSTFVADHRNRPGRAVGLAVSSRGADHLKGRGTLDLANRPDIAEFWFGKPDSAKPNSIAQKGAQSKLIEQRNALVNALGICVFAVAGDPVRYPNEMFSQALRAVTGESISPAELDAAAERITNLEKAFNSRLGYRRRDDTLCERWMKEPEADGPGKGWKCEDYLEQLKDEYYDYHGWDRATSLQKSEGLKALGLEDVADVLKKENALA